MERKKYLMIDTEAIGFTGKSYQDCIVYNLGAVVTDKQGEVYCEKGFIFLDNIVRNLKRFDSSFLRKKIVSLFQSPEYEAVDFIEGRKILLKMIDEFNIQGIIMQNAEFDYNALNATMRNNGFCDKFFPITMPIFDLVLMARDTIGKQKTYGKQFEGAVSVSTKYLYPYIIGNKPVAHLALDDAKQQVKIWERINRQHKKMNKFFMKG